ncbi:MAG: hypothetical protein ACI9HE_003360, partial [Planctomycetota bacterium]
MAPHRFLARVITILPLLLQATTARGQELIGGQVPVTVVDQRLVVSCDLSTPSRRIPVNLFVEYEGAYGLQLHNKAADGLKAETADGQAVPITIHFPGFGVTVPRREIGDEEYLEEFTKYHSVELGENAIVGSIGAEVLAQYSVTFDLAAGMLGLMPPGEAPQVPLGEPLRGEDGSWTVPISESSGLAWVPVVLDDGTPMAMALGCAHYDTRMEAQLADELGAPAGDVGGLHLGGFDLSEYVAFRPEELVLVHPNGAFGSLGVNLLEHFRVEIDRVAATARFTQVKSAAFPVADLEFFQARVSEDRDHLEAYLDVHGETRLGHEAAELLLNWCLEEGAKPESSAKAVRWMYETTIEDLRSTRMLDLMKEMADAGQPSVELAAGELGVESGRDDRYPNAVHFVHGRMGRVLLDRDEVDESWRHLLSAAFGLPGDGRINLDLGRCYEAQGRMRRAFSRYIQAVIVPETGPEAIAALERVQPQIEDAEPLSVDVIERMIAGKVKNFGAASTFVPSDENPAKRVTLAEFFTSAHLGDGRAGAIGGALGNEGLVGHFAPEHVAFLSWHLPEPSLSPLCTAAAAARAATLGLDQPTVHIIDGVVTSPGAARSRQAEAVYNRVRRDILRRLGLDTGYLMEMEARIEGDKLSGELLVSHLYDDRERDMVVRLVLAEKGVLFPGKSTVVVHRMLGRAFLLESDGSGLDFEPDDDGLERFAFEVSLQDMHKAQESYLD